MADAGVPVQADHSLDITEKQQHHQQQSLHPTARGIASHHENDVSGTVTPDEKAKLSHTTATETFAHHDVEKTGGYNYEVEKARSSSDPEPEAENKDNRPSAAYRLIKPILLAVIAVKVTAWWICGLVLYRHKMNWVIPFLFWLAVMVRIITIYIPMKIFFKPVKWTWENTAVRATEQIPIKMRTKLGAAITLVVILVGSFASAESEDNTRANRAVSLFGLATFIFGFWLTSRNRSKIVWHTVIVGMLVQFLIALFVLRSKVGYDIFNFISKLARLLLGFADQGTIFLTSDKVPALHWFLTSVIPAIIFFVSLVQLLYYWGTLQWFIKKFASFFFWSMRVSGAEAVVAAASPFVGQGESAMLIKPFVPYLTMAELHQVMCSGFATIAGSVLVAYIGMGLNAQALISSCVMSIPASLAFSKLRYPEEEKTLTAGRVVIPANDEDKPANALHAFANGAWLGLKIAGMIIATLLCIIALLHLVDGFLTWYGHYIHLHGEHDLTLEMLLGYIFFPVAFLLGVSRENKGHQLLLVGRLIGIKVIFNEFVAFFALTGKTPSGDPDPNSPYRELSPRSRVIATYALCGFGNIGSLGTQIGVLSQLSPARSGDVSRLALSALISGVFSTLSSATVAGLVVVDQGKFSPGT